MFVFGAVDNVKLSASGPVSATVIVPVSSCGFLLPLFLTVTVIARPVAMVSA
jgi:hypothetical protein